MSLVQCKLSKKLTILYEFSNKKSTILLKFSQIISLKRYVSRNRLTHYAVFNFDTLNNNLKLSKIVRNLQLVLLIRLCNSSMCIIVYFRALPMPFNFETLPYRSILRTFNKLSLICYHGFL